MKIKKNEVTDIKETIQVLLLTNSFSSDTIEQVNSCLKTSYQTLNKAIILEYLDVKLIENGINLRSENYPVKPKVLSEDEVVNSENYRTEETYGFGVEIRSFAGDWGRTEEDYTVFINPLTFEEATIFKAVLELKKSKIKLQDNKHKFYNAFNSHVEVA